MYTKQFIPGPSQLQAQQIMPHVAVPPQRSMQVGSLEQQLDPIGQRFTQRFVTMPSGQQMVAQPRPYQSGGTAQSLAQLMSSTPPPPQPLVMRPELQLGPGQITTAPDALTASAAVSTCRGSFANVVWADTLSVAAANRYSTASYWTNDPSQPARNYTVADHCCSSDESFERASVANPPRGRWSDGGLGHELCCGGASVDAARFGGCTFARPAPLRNALRHSLRDVGAARRRRGRISAATAAATASSDAGLAACVRWADQYHSELRERVHNAAFYDASYPTRTVTDFRRWSSTNAIAGTARTRRDRTAATVRSAAFDTTVAGGTEHEYAAELNADDFACAVRL